jgi:hypothetical protein
MGSIMLGKMLGAGASLAITNADKGLREKANSHSNRKSCKSLACGSGRGFFAANDVTVQVLMSALCEQGCYVIQA